MFGTYNTSIKPSEVRTVKPAVRKILYAAFIVGTLGVVLFLAVQSGDLASSIAAIGGIPLWYVGLGAVLTFGAIFAQTLSACSALRCMGHSVGLLTMFRISILGEFYCYITPGASGGQPMVIYQLYKRKVPVGDGTSVQLAHHLFFQIALTVITTVLGVLYRDFIVRQVGPSLPVLVVGYCFNVLVVILLLLLCLTRRPVRWAVKLVALLAGKLRIQKLAELEETMLDTADQFYAATQRLKRNKPEIARQLVIGALRVVSLNSVMYLVYRGLGLSGYGYGQLLAMSVMLYNSAAYAPMPGASGAQEGVFALYFAGIFQDSLLFSGMLAWRFITFYLVLAVGVVVMLSMGANRQEKEVEALKHKEHELKAEQAVE